MGFLASSIILMNPGPSWVDNVMVQSVPRTNVAIPNIQIDPPIATARAVRPIKIMQVLEIYTP